MRFDGLLFDVWWGKAVLLRSILTELLNGVVQVLLEAAEELLVVRSVPLHVPLQVHLLAPLLVVGALVQVLFEVSDFVYLTLLPEPSG